MSLYQNVLIGVPSSDSAMHLKANRVVRADITILSGAVTIFVLSEIRGSLLNNNNIITIKNN